MLKRATARSKAIKITNTTNTTSSPSSKPTSHQSSNAPPNNSTTSSASSSSLLFHATDPIVDSNGNSGSVVPPEDEIIERVRLKIPNAHVFKLPPKPSSGGWRGGDWRDKVWQGTLKVVERGDDTAVLLVDSAEERNIFAVCPIRHNIETTNGHTTSTNLGNGVDRCIDSSRYFVLRIQNAQGRHMYIGLAFNERNDAFDFNTALEDSRREKEVERKVALGMLGGVGSGKVVDYTMKEGEKIHVSIPNTNNINDGGGNDGNSSPTEQQQQNAATRRRDAKKSSNQSQASSLLWPLSSNGRKGGGTLKPSLKDTPSRLA
jgi:hypothetical protein